MIRDLNLKYDFGSMTKEDIRFLLGKPDVDQDDEIEYVVSEGWIDPKMLVFRFENQLAVEEYTYIEFKANKLDQFMLVE